MKQILRLTRATSMGLTIILLLAAAGTAMANPVTLNYDAEAYAYAYAYGTSPDFDSDNQSSNNAPVTASAYADMWDTSQGSNLERESWTDASVSGSYDSAGAEITSTIKGRGQYTNWDTLYIAPQGGSGNGWTSLTGTLEIGYPAGNAGTLTADAIVDHVITAPDGWYDWKTLDWWLKIWDTDPGSPLMLLNDGNLSGNLGVLGGQILNMEFYYEADLAPYAWGPPGRSGKHGDGQLLSNPGTSHNFPANLRLFSS